MRMFIISSASLLRWLADSLLDHRAFTARFFKLTGEERKAVKITDKMKI